MKKLLLSTLVFLTFGSSYAQTEPSVNNKFDLRELDGELLGIPQSGLLGKYCISGWYDFTSAIREHGENLKLITNSLLYPDTSLLFSADSGNCLYVLERVFSMKDSLSNTSPS